jgi:PAS domain-containing protein
MGPRGRFHAVARDITRERAQQLAIREDFNHTSATLEAVVDTIPDIIWMVNHYGHLNYVNER